MDLEAEESASHPTLLPCLSKGGAARFMIKMYSKGALDFDRLIFINGQF